MSFREKLPDGCPPQNCHQGACDAAYRLVPTQSPVAADFASNAAKQEPLLVAGDPCRWASCSLYTDLQTVHKKRKTFKKLRNYSFVALIKIAAGSGHILIENTHIDFWMFDSFDPVQAIVDVKAL